MRDTLILARQRMAKFYNRKVSEREPGFKVGDWVMLKQKIKTSAMTNTSD